MKWLLRAVVAFVVIYVTLCGTVAIAMMQTPERNFDQAPALIDLDAVPKKGASSA